MLSMSVPSMSKKRPRRCVGRAAGQLAAYLQLMVVPMPRVTPRPRLALASALVALLAHVSGWVLTDRLQADPFDATTTGLSVLAATGQPHAWLFTTSLLVSAAALAVVSFTLPRIRAWGRAVLALSAVSVGIFALSPLDLARSPGSPRGRGLRSARRSLRVAVGGHRSPHAPLGYAAGSAFAVVLLAATLTDRLDWPEGTTERLVTMLLLSGLATSAGLAWWNAGHRVGSRPVRQILAFALTAVACALTGVSATAIARCVRRPVTMRPR